MQNATLWRALLGVEKTVVEDVEFDEDEQVLVAHVRPTRARPRAGAGGVGRRSPGYDRGEGRRRWRALDLGTIQVLLEADAPRVRCREHGPTVAAVPWARHGAGHTRVFDEQVAWLATQCSKTAVTELMRIAWRTVGAIIARVWADVEAAARPVRRAAPDRDRRDLLQARPQVPDRRGRPRHRPAGVGRAGPGQGHPGRVLRRARAEQRCAQITHVSADGADWIADVVAEQLPERGPLRRPVPRRAVGHRGARRGPPAGLERRPRTRSPSRRAGPRRTGHAEGAEARPLRAVEEPREPHRPAAGQARLDRQDRPPAAPRLPAQRRPPAGLPARPRPRPPTRSRPGSAGPAAAGSPRSSTCNAGSSNTRHSILAAIEHGLSNGRIESVNTKIRLITRIAFGFRSPRSPHRPRHAQPRRPPPTPPRPDMTHGSVRRAANFSPNPRRRALRSPASPSSRLGGRSPGARRFARDRPGRCAPIAPIA